MKSWEIKSSNITIWREKARHTNEGKYVNTSKTPYLGFIIIWWDELCTHYRCHWVTLLEPDLLLTDLEKSSAIPKISLNSRVIHPGPELLVLVNSSSLASVLTHCHPFFLISIKWISHTTGAFYGTSISIAGIYIAEIQSTENPTLENLVPRRPMAISIAWVTAFLLLSCLSLLPTTTPTVTGHSF